MTGTTLITKPAIHRSPDQLGPLHLGLRRRAPLASRPLATRGAHLRRFRRGRRRRSLTEHLSLVLSRIGDRERGDVPGWVLITLMTAGLVVALWAIAGNVLTEMFESALKSVKGP